MIDTYQWFVGLDWGTERHQVCVMDGGGRVAGERSFTHDGEGLSSLCRWLLSLCTCSADRIAVAIEVPHGAVVETLLDRGFVVFVINPKQLDRFRDRFTLAGAKDDRRDARVAADALRTDGHRLRRLHVRCPTVIQLREWSRMAEDLSRERVQLANRMRQQLWRYYPQALKVTDDIAAEWFLDLWHKVPTPDKARRARPGTIARILGTRGIRRLDAAGLLDILRQPPVTVAPGTVEAACAHIGALAERLRLVNRQIAQTHKRLDALCAGFADQGAAPDGEGQRDVDILHSLPGVGRIVLATLLAEAYQPLRERDYQVLRTLCGVAPVTRQSGKTRRVVMRYACSARLRTALYHWSRVAIQHDARSRTRYQALRARGHSHGRALRGVGDRLLAVACAMLRSRTLFDPARARVAAA